MDYMSAAVVGGKIDMRKVKVLVGSRVGKKVKLNWMSTKGSPRPDVPSYI